MKTTVSLRRVAHVTYGLGQPPALSTVGVPILRATNIERGRINPDGLIYARVQDLPLDRSPLLQEGEILVVRSGAYTGDSALVTKEWVGAAPGYDLRVSPNEVAVHPRFLAWSLLSSTALDQMVLASSRAAQPHLNADELGSVRLVLPHVDHQYRIADFLDDQVARIDAALMARGAQLELLDDAIVAAAHSGVTHADSGTPAEPSSVPWTSALPHGWGSPRICQVAKMGTGHTPSRTESEYWKDCHIPWLTTGDVHHFRHDEVDVISDTALLISDLGLANSAAVLHPRGTVALSRTASAGFSVIMATDMATSQDFATWTCGPRLHNGYLLWCLRAMRRDLLQRLAMGSTHKTIYFPDLMSIRIPLPPMKEQIEIASRITEAADAIRRSLALVRRSMDLLAEYKQSLITAAVTGELDVATVRPVVPA